jgi:hypothetical protein
MRTDARVTFLHACLIHVRIIQHAFLLRPRVDCCTTRATCGSCTPFFLQSTCGLLHCLCVLHAHPRADLHFNPCADGLHAWSTCGFTLSSTCGCPAHWSTCGSGALISVHVRTDILSSVRTSNPRADCCTPLSSFDPRADPSIYFYARSWLSISFCLYFFMHQYAYTYIHMSTIIIFLYFYTYVSILLYRLVLFYTQVRLHIRLVY